MIATEDAVFIPEPPSQAEGESGAETVGFTAFGSQRNTDAQKRRCRPTSVELQWNYTTVVPQRGNPVPPAYWGTFITAFDGTVLAGSRNDGVGATTAPWSGLPPDPARRFSDGAGGNVGLATTSYNVIGQPNNVGFDIFINLLHTSVNVTIDYRNFYLGGLPFSNTIVLNSVPQVGSYSMAGQPASIAPFLIVRRRPEGYLPNEDGAQVFLNLPYATTPYPAGFVDPALVGVPITVVPSFLRTNIIP